MSTITRSLRRLPFPPAQALPLATHAIATVGFRPVSQGAGPDLWAAGERATVSSQANGAIAGSVARAARPFELALGLGDLADRRIDVLDDRFHGTSVREITYLDARGRAVGLVRLATDGRLLAAVHLGFREAYATGSLSEAAAVRRAATLVRDLGLAVPVGPPATRRQMNGLQWTVTWPRVVAGVPVDGDGLTVRLWRSSDLHSVTITERPLMRPSRTMDASSARAMLDAALPALLSGERPTDAALEAMGLHWVAANDRYRPSGADAPAPALRLAYVFELRFSGASAATVRAATFWIDAETGDLLGGDVLR